MVTPQKQGEDRCETVPVVVVKTPERMKWGALALAHSCGVLRCCGLSVERRCRSHDTKKMHGVSTQENWLTRYNSLRRHFDFVFLEVL
jgi:hypothetical protein